ncbi:MAG: antibiotic biosynthesis monooxygenase [Chitinophaga sp.]|jgi:heme-degrading monooxygenase HmoA|nr:antibiotic biosynthesis monooxygenase [Chitinophaga sp.]
MIAKTPKPPYYAVIFTSVKENDLEGYNEMADKMEALAKQQPGFLGMESASKGISITVSYWESLDAIKLWKQHAEHIIAQQYGREKWYEQYKTRICLVERDYGFEK